MILLNLDHEQCANCLEQVSVWLVNFQGVSRNEWVEYILLNMLSFNHVLLDCLRQRWVPVQLGNFQGHSQNESANFITCWICTMSGVQLVLDCLRLRQVTVWHAYFQGHSPNEWVKYKTGWICTMNCVQYRMEVGVCVTCSFSKGFPE